MKIQDIISDIKPRPHGHVDNLVANKLRVASSAPIETTDDLQEINGLVARARYLRDAPPVHDDLPPDGGSAAPMAIAA